MDTIEHDGYSADFTTELRQAVDEIGPMVARTVSLPWSGVSYLIEMPLEIDSLLDRIAGDPEQNLPYWAELWPSGIALADAIEMAPEMVSGRPTIEIGCGLGITAAAALRAGSSLTVTDYAAEALTLCRFNACRNAGREPETARINWRNLDVIDGRPATGQFPVVLAADVLYERRDIEPMIELMQLVLEPGGALWLAEPGRAVAAEFLLRIDALGWDRCSQQHFGPWPDPADDGVVVGIHQIRIHR